MEQILESLVFDGHLADSDYILSNLYNSAFCYQKLSNLNKLTEYLEAITFNIENKRVMKNKTSSGRIQYIVDKIRKNKFYGRILYQLCAFKSQCGNHEKALALAKRANVISQ